MDTKKVKEVMIPLSDYTTVNENDTLEKAVKMLCLSQKGLAIDAYKHRAILVYNETGEITGKVSIFDILRALEPKYSQFGHSDHLNKIGLSRFGLSNDFLHSLVENYSLWDESCESLVKKAKKRIIKEIMYSPQEGEYVSEDISVPEAIHQFILGNHQSMLVVKKDKVVGILRLTDIFKIICDLIVKE